VLFVTLGFILSVCWWARPLIRNETVEFLELIRFKSRAV
jgi:hypothetical protein